MERVKLWSAKTHASSGNYKRMDDNLMKMIGMWCNRGRGMDSAVRLSLEGTLRSHRLCSKASKQECIHSRTTIPRKKRLLFL